MPQFKVYEEKHDLCPKKPSKMVMDVGDTNVVVTVTLDAKGPIPTTKAQRIVATAVKPEIDRYTKVISEEVKILEGKILEMVKKKDTAGAEKMASETSMSVQNACKSLQGAVNVAVKARLAKEARDDQNLLEAKIVVGLKISFKVISIAKSVTEIAVSGGADVTAWISAAKGVYDLAKMVQDACKDEPALRDELLAAIGKYTTAKTRAVAGIKPQGGIKAQAGALATGAKNAITGGNAKAVVKGASSAGDLAKTLMKDGSVKGAAEKAESSRKKYRNKVTSLRQEVDKLSGKVDALKKMVSSEPKVAGKLGTMETKLGGMNETYQKAETFSEDMAFLMTEQGLKLDDRTFASKLGSLASLKDAAPMAKEAFSAAKDVVDIIKSLAN